MTTTPLPQKRSGLPIVPLVTAASALSAIGGLAVLLWTAGGGSLVGGAGSRTVAPGVAAPDFTLPTTDSRTMHLADYKGRAVFLAFVPSWDDVRTRTEARALKAVAAQFDMAGAKVMLAGPQNTGDDAKRAQALHDGEKLPFPVLLDSSGALAKQYGVPPGYRTTFVVTPKGMVQYRVSDAALDAKNHGQQLIDVSKCCIDEVTADRAHGVGKAVGDYSLPLAADGTMATLYGDSKQRATVALFLSTKCPCANSYNDRIRSWIAKYGPDSGVRFVGIYANRDESAADIAAHAKAQGFTFPVFRDDDGGLGAAHFGASVTPEVFVMDGTRTLRYAGRLDDSREPAEVHEHDLTNALDAILAGKPVANAETRAFGCSIVK